MDGADIGGTQLKSFTDRYRVCHLSGSTDPLELRRSFPVSALNCMMDGEDGDGEDGDGEDGFVNGITVTLLEEGNQMATRNPRTQQIKSNKWAMRFCVSTDSQKLPECFSCNPSSMCFRTHPRSFPLNLFQALSMDI
jgi:hypothetical protein